MSVLIRSSLALSLAGAALLVVSGCCPRHASRLAGSKIIRQLGLEPLEIEGGYYRATYSSNLEHVTDRPGGTRPMSTAILYLLTEDTISAIHRLESDEIWHFYSGDPVSLHLFHPDGRSERVVLGSDVTLGHRVQQVVPADTWQGATLVAGGSYALMGTTVSPGFDVRDFELADPVQLLRSYPDRENWITRLTRK